MMKKTEHLTKKEFGIALRSTLPIMTGYLALGFGFGVLLRSKGFGVLWALGISCTMYSGAMQYVAVDLLAGGVPLLTVALTTLMVNARHLFYGLSILENYKGAGLRKGYMIFALTDETYSLVCSGVPDGIEHRYAYYFCVSLLDHLYWISGCVLGAATGSVLPFNSKGIDFVLTALFITIFLEQWLQSKKHVYALIGVGSTLLCRVVFGSEQFLIPSMALIALSLFLLRAIRKEEALQDG